MEKTIEERIAALEAQHVDLSENVSTLSSMLTDEALIARIDPIVCGLVAAHSGEIVKIGVADLARNVGKSLISPFVWVGEKIFGTSEERAAAAAEDAAEAAPAENTEATTATA